MRRAAVVAITLAVAYAFGAGVPARATSLGPDGSREGTAFLDLCPVGQYLVGVSGSRWQFVDAIQPLCANDNGVQLGAPALRGVVHGSGTPIAQLACAPQAAIRSVALAYMRDDTGAPAHIGDVSLPCEPVTGGPAQPDFAAVCLDGGQACAPLKATADAFEQCPQGEIATGLIGRNDQSLTALGLVCSAAPARALAPGGIAALPLRQVPVIASAGPAALAGPTGSSSPPTIPSPQPSVPATPPGGSAVASAGTAPPLPPAAPPSIAPSTPPVVPPAIPPTQPAAPSVAAIGPGALPPATPPSVQPAPVPPATVDLVRCLGGAGMTTVTGNDGTTRILFMPATTAGPSVAPQLGQCAWSDHAFKPGEPFVLLFPAGIAPTIPVQAASNGLPFQVHARDDGKGSLVVTSVETPTPVNPFAATGPVTPVDPFARTAPPPAAAPASPPVAAIPMQAVVTQAVNARSGPGTASAVLGLLQGGAVVQVDHCANGWCQLAQPIAQKTAWVLQQYLRFSAPFPSAGGPSG